MMAKPKKMTLAQWECLPLVPAPKAPVRTERKTLSEWNLEMGNPFIEGPDSNRRVMPRKRRANGRIHGR